MPPCLASPASETSGIAKTHKTATASACTLRMVPLPRIRSETGRFAADDSMTAGLGNPAWPLSLLLLRTRKGARHFVHRHRRWLRGNRRATSVQNWALQTLPLLVEICDPSILMTSTRLSVESVG